MAAAAAAIEEALLRAWVAAAGGEEVGLRREDRKKAREVAALLGTLPRGGRPRTVVDAAAGHGYIGLFYAHLCGARRLILIEHDPGRAARCAAAASRLGLSAITDVREGRVGDLGLWPAAPDLVLSLHACGAASDEVIDGAVAVRARWLFLVPCCYGRDVPFAQAASLRAEALGLPRQAALRRRFVETLVDAERILRLEAAGYEVTAAPLLLAPAAPPNLLLRARRTGEPALAAAAAARLARLRGGEESTASWEEGKDAPRHQPPRSGF